MELAQMLQINPLHLVWKLAQDALSLPFRMLRNLWNPSSPSATGSGNQLKQQIQEHYDLLELQQSMGIDVSLDPKVVAEPMAMRKELFDRLTVQTDQLESLLNTPTKIYAMDTQEFSNIIQLAKGAYDSLTQFHGGCSSEDLIKYNTLLRRFDSTLDKAETLLSQIKIWRKTAEDPRIKGMSRQNLYLKNQIDKLKLTDKEQKLLQKLQQQQVESRLGLDDSEQKQLKGLLARKNEADRLEFAQIKLMRRMWRLMKSLDDAALME
jgi:hypothetical protein